MCCVSAASSGRSLHLIISQLRTKHSSSNCPNHVRRSKSSIKNRIVVRRTVRSMFGEQTVRPFKNGLNTAPSPSLCIKMGIGPGHFDGTLIVTGKATKTMSVNHNFCRERKAEAGNRTEVTLLTSLTPNRLAKPVNSSVQFKVVSMRSQKPICAPPRLSDVSSTLPFKQFQCSSD